MATNVRLFEYHVCFLANWISRIALARRYWTLARIAADNEPQADAKLPASDETGMRTRVRLAAETSKTAVELKPCQNVIDYQLPFKISAVKN